MKLKTKTQSKEIMFSIKRNEQKLRAKELRAKIRVKQCCSGSKETNYIKEKGVVNISSVINIADNKVKETVIIVSYLVLIGCFDKPTMKDTERCIFIVHLNLRR